MGTITAGSIINKAVLQLNDLTAVRWTRAELLEWVNDAQRQIVTIAPNSSNFTATVQMVAGSRQSIPADGWMLLDVYRSMGTTGSTPGRAVRIVSKELIDSFNPDWHSDTTSVAPKNYVFNTQDQTTYWVYPPNTGTGYIQINYAKVPAVITSEAATITVNDVLQTAILDYILYRACSKDAEYAAGLVLAQGYWTAFTAGLGAKERAESINNPNLALSPAPVPPGVES